MPFIENAGSSLYSYIFIIPIQNYRAKQKFRARSYWIHVGGDVYLQSMYMKNWKLAGCFKRVLEREKERETMKR